jgi:PQQ-dependent dehydrogenase (methanol/ethanol family)
VPTNRGVTIANGRVYLLTFDDQLISLQQATGEELWDTRVANSAVGLSEPSPPTYWNGLLFVGSAGSESGERGFEAAYDASTGTQVWRFYTVPLPGQGWMPALGEHGGGDVWMPAVVDTTTGIVYFGTGNPSPDEDNSKRPGCNPWADAIVALDGKTGKFLWAHSEYCNDVWDYDSMPQPMLFDVTINGQTIRAVGHANKSSLYYIYDAKTGKVLWQTPPLANFSEPHLKPSPKGALICPGALGGIEYTSGAYSPITGYSYQSVANECEIYTLAPRNTNNVHKLGGQDFGGGVVQSGKFTGYMVAVDTATGKVAWKIPMASPMNGGAMATAGGLVFAGGEDGYFYAFDAATGKILWKTYDGLGHGAAPLTYEVNGVQYIAEIAGGAGVSGLEGAKGGGTLAVFKLNGSPTHPFPVGKPATSGPVHHFDFSGLTKINQWMYVDTTHQVVAIKLTAAATSANNGFNFDGYYNGQANFIVPLGWIVDWVFVNHSAIPHSAALVISNSVPPKLANAAPGIFGGALAPVETPLAQSGVAQGIEQDVNYNATVAGNFVLACLVPGHLQSGMWDHYTVTASATMPSVQVSQ